METTTKRTKTLFYRILNYRTLFFTVTTICYVFSPTMSKSLHALRVKICMVIQKVVCLFHCCHHCWNTPPTTHCAHMHSLVSINIQKASMNVTGCHFFLVEEFSDTPLLHPHFHVRCYSISLSLCCICHTATTCNSILVGRFNLYWCKCYSMLQKFHAAQESAREEQAFPLLLTWGSRSPHAAMEEPTA